MLNNTSNQHLENISLWAQVSFAQKQLLVQKYLQSPFSIPWSKLAALFQADQALNQPEVNEKDQFEQHEFLSTPMANFRRYLPLKPALVKQWIDFPKLKVVRNCWRWAKK